MAANAENDIAYYLSINKAKIESLSNLRQWENLKLCFDKDKIWVNNFSKEQIESILVKQIAYKEIYYSKNGKLYPINSLLPTGSIPNGMWTSIWRALPIELPKLNHNYFGLKASVKINFIQSEVYREASGMIISIDILKHYIITAPQVRLERLRWTILNKKLAFLIGAPILPLNEKTYYLDHGMFIPIGYKFELSILLKLIQNRVDPKNDHSIVWNENGEYFRIDNNLFTNLSRSSFNKSLLHHQIELNHDQ